MERDQRYYVWNWRHRQNCFWTLDEAIDYAKQCDSMKPYPASRFIVRQGRLEKNPEIWDAATQREGDV